MRCMFGVLLGLTRAPWRAMRWCGRKWRWVAGFLVVLIVAHATAALITGHMVAREIQLIKQRGEPVNMADLSGPKIPNYQNAAPLYLEALRMLPADKELGQIIMGARPPQPGVPPPATGAETAERLLSRHTALFNLVEQAAARPACRFPGDWDKDFDRLFRNVWRTRRLADMLRSRALLQARRADSHGAFNSLALVLKIADHVGSEPARAAEFTRLATTAGAARALPLVMSLAPPSREDCERMDALLSGIRLVPSAVRAMQCTRCRAIVFFDHVRSSPGQFRVRVLQGDLGYRVSFLDLWKRKPGWARRIGARLILWAWAPLLNMDELTCLRIAGQAIRIAGQPYRDAKSALNASDNMIAQWRWYALGTRAIQPGAGRFVILRELSAAHIGLAQWALALRVYQIEKGSYPDSLDQVRKAVGWRLPEDPFSGKDFIYRRDGQGYVLYSIGPDLKDDGGMDPLVWERTPLSKRPRQPGYGGWADEVLRMAR